MLEVQGLVKYYGARCVVDGVDFRVDQGEIVGLLGPNGAGKTTSFRMTCGMIEPNQGKVVLNNLDVTRWPMYRRAREGGMGYLAQESSVFRKLTVEKNLLGVMELLGMDRKTRYARCDELLDQFDIKRLRKAVGPLALRRRAAAAGDRPGTGLQSQDHPVGRTLHGHRPGDDRQHPEDHSRPEERRHRDPDHRPPGPRDSADHGPPLRDSERQGALPRPSG